MKITNQEIIKAIDAIHGMAEKEMPVKLTFKLLKLKKLLWDSYEIYLDSLDRFRNDKEKIKALLSIKTDIPIEPFLMSDFIDADIKLTPEQAEGLQVFINGEHST